MISRTTSQAQSYERYMHPPFIVYLEVLLRTIKMPDLLGITYIDIVILVVIKKYLLFIKCLQSGNGG